MDYSLLTPEERKAKVEEIIQNTPSEKLTPQYLEKLADYLVFAMDKEEKKDKKILTDNRLVTINKRETSFESINEKMENCEDNIYNLIIEPDKRVILQPKKEITQKDLQEIEDLKALKDIIVVLEEKSKNAKGKNAYLLKKQIIQLRQDQYIIKEAYRKPVNCVNLIKSLSKVDLSENIKLVDGDKVVSDGIINLYNEKHISLLLQNYSELKQDSYSDFNSDTKWLLMDLENLIDAALEEKYPVLYTILICKIDGLSNSEIQEKIKEEHNVSYSAEYISSVWRNKIPKLIAKEASRQWIEWHFLEEEKGQWKKCSRCGKIKLVNKINFSKNEGGKDGFYSICKECRNKKRKESKT